LRLTALYDARCVRSKSATHHSNQRVPVLAHSRLIVIRNHFRSVHLTACDYQNRGIDWFTPIETLWWIALVSWGLFVPSLALTKSQPLCSLFGDLPLTPLSHSSLRPVSAVLRALSPHVLRDTMLREAPDRFRPESRDALEDFTIRGAFPRQAIHDSACPLKTPIVNCHPPRDFAHRTSDCRLRFTLRLTPVAFAPPRGFLFEGRDACLARMLSRGFSSVGLGPRPPAPPIDVGEPALLDRRRSSTSATEIRRTGTLSSAIILARDRSRDFLRNYASFHVCVASASEETSRPQRAKTIRFTTDPFRDATANHQRSWPLGPFTCAKETGTESGRQSRAEGAPFKVSSPPR